MSIIEKVLLRDSIETLIVIAMLVGIFFLIRIPIKGGAWPKWVYAIWSLVTLIILIVLIIGLLKIVLDIREKTFVTYEGIYFERGGSQSGLKTVVVFDEDGNEIRLLRTGTSKKGEYIGKVVYGERSKIVVEYNGEPLTKAGG